MKIKFKNKTLDIKNESNSRREFYANWNGYNIEISPYETHIDSKGSRKLKYESYCVNPLGSWICNSTTHNNISEGLQECFNNIEIDIDDMKSNYDEIGEILELLKDYI